jgi:hypothetical protein
MAISAGRRVAKRYWRSAVPLGLAALLMLGSCDEEEEKKPEVEVHVPKGVEVRIKRIDDDDEMVIVAELLALGGVVVWALFGPGARRRWPDRSAPTKSPAPNQTNALENG